MKLNSASSLWRRSSRALTYLFLARRVESHDFTLALSVTYRIISFLQVADWAEASTTKVNSSNTAIIPRLSPDPTTSSMAATYLWHGSEWYFSAFQSAAPSRSSVASPPTNLVDLAMPGRASLSRIGSSFPKATLKLAPHGFSI